MKKTFLIALLTFCMNGAIAQTVSVTSPDGQLVVNIANTNGNVNYSVSYAGQPMLMSSPLGFICNEADFSKGLTTLAVEQPKSITSDYTLDRCKVSQVRYEANVLKYPIQDKKGNKVIIVFYVSNNDIAFRYEIARLTDGRRATERGSIRIEEEKTGFCFPEKTTTFLCPQSEAMIGWKRSKPSYEEDYKYDAPMTDKSKYGNGYTFPCLFKIGEDGWVLISETGVDSRYCGSRLSDCKDNTYKVDFPLAEENNGNGTVAPAIGLPGTTPWRTITIGKTLKPIVETTAPWNTVAPKYSLSNEMQALGNKKYGKSTWSWIIWQDASMNWTDQLAYIDLAQQMGYSYILIDAGWDKEIGYDKMEELVRIAQSKGVDVFLWWSSSGYWNDIVQTPVNCMDNSIIRKEKMRWMKKIGVKGIKVDFWGGDKQETMRLYEDVLSDANDNDLMVIFHGCTIPRGWERMYPNYVGSEAVLASENLVFSQGFCDMEAINTATHPFIRNTIGCMEWGGSVLNKRHGRNNQRGTFRRVTDCHQLAQAVLFQNPIQNFAITPENLKTEEEGGASPISVEFMKSVPTLWDKTLFIDGYPGKFAVLARKSGETWYIAGNNAIDQQTLILDLSEIVKKGDVVTLYSDDKNLSPKKTQLKISNPKKVKVSVPKNGGFVMVLSK